MREAQDGGLGVLRHGTALEILAAGVGAEVAQGDHADQAGPAGIVAPIGGQRLARGEDAEHVGRKLRQKDPAQPGLERSGQFERVEHEHPDTAARGQLVGDRLVRAERALKREHERVRRCLDIAHIEVDRRSLHPLADVGEFVQQRRLADAARPVHIQHVQRQRLYGQQFAQEVTLGLTPDGIGAASCLQTFGEVRRHDRTLHQRMNEDSAARTPRLFRVPLCSSIGGGRVR